MVDYKQVYYIPKIENILEESMFLEGGHTDSIQNIFEQNVRILKNEIGRESAMIADVDFPYDLNTANFDILMIQNLLDYVTSLKEYYNKVFSRVNSKKDLLINEMQSDDESRKKYVGMRNKSQNEFLSDVVKNIYAENKIVVINDRLVQLIDPIFNLPDKDGLFSYRAQFYAPKKSIFNRYFDTYTFNMGVIWLFSIILFFTLYFESLKKLLSLNMNIKFRKTK